MWKDKEFFMHMEPMKYWDPSDSAVSIDILEHPEKYNNYIAARKMDGEWAKVIWDGREVVIQSRSISKKTGEYAHKEASLPHLVEEFKKLPKNTVILGELCYDDLYKRSRDVGTILRCLPEKAIERQRNDADKLHFYCFDVLAYNSEMVMNYNFVARIIRLQEVEKVLGKNNKYIRYAEYLPIEMVSEIYQDYLNKGGEGFVLQRNDNPYQPGKRPAWATIKLKKHTEEIELPVVGFIDPVKEYTGKELSTWQYFEGKEPVTKYYYMGWKAGVQVDNKGTICNIASGISDTDAEWLATKEAKKLLENGQIYAKCSAMEIEPDTGKMRHPVLIELRTDL